MIKPDFEIFAYKNILLSELVVFEELTDTNAISTVSQALPCIPIIVTPDEYGMYTIIDGVKRFNALKNKGITECLCGIVQSISPAQSGKLRILFNSNRLHSSFEKFLFLKWLRNNCPSDEYKELTLFLNVADRERHDFEQLFTSSPNIVNSVLKGYVDITNAAELNSYTSDDCMLVIDFLSQLQFSRQTQRELLEWLPELAFRTKESIQLLLSAPVVRKIIGDDKLNGPQKIKKLRDYFYESRFPTLVSARKAWNAIVSKSNPDPANITFNSSEAFEKNILELKIRITDSKKAREIMSQLADISEETWESLIYPALLFSIKK